MKGEITWNYGIFGSFFRRKSRAAERRYELNYRMELADLRRKAEHLKRDAQQCRKKHINCKFPGTHFGSIKASMAMNHEKGYQTYLRMIRQCETMYAQSKTQKALMDLMKGCQDVSTAVIKQVDTEGVIKAQERLQQTSIQMDQLQESMRIFQEGFEPDADPSVREIAGEEALAAIMAEYEQNRLRLREFGRRSLRMHQKLILLSWLVMSGHSRNALSYRNWCEQGLRRCSLNG